MKRMSVNHLVEIQQRRGAHQAVEMDKVDCTRSDNTHASPAAKKTFVLTPEVEVNSV
jgi:hypothetical protein